MNHRTLLSAAAIAAATIVGASAAHAQQSDPMQQQQQQQRMGGTGGMSQQRQPADRLIAQATNAAVNDGDLSDLLPYLTQADRARIQAGQLQAGNLDQTSRQVRDAWQQRYNQPFAISTANVSFQGADARRADMSGMSGQQQRQGTVDPNAVYTDTRRGSEQSLTGQGELRGSDTDRARDDLRSRTDLSTGDSARTSSSSSNGTASGTSSGMTGTASAGGSADRDGAGGEIQIGNRDNRSDARTGTHADFRGTSDRIGGRDIPETDASASTAGGRVDSSTSTNSGGAGTRGDVQVGGARAGASGSVDNPGIVGTEQSDNRAAANAGASGGGTGVQMSGDMRPYEQTGISGTEGRTAEPAGASDAQAGMSERTSSQGTGAMAGGAGSTSGGSSGMDTSVRSGTDADMPARTAGYTDANQQRQTVTIPASHGVPATTVTLVREGTDWRIDVPDSVDGQQLARNLERHLSMLHTDSQTWPQDQTEAYRLAAHHVMAALSGTGVM